MLVNITRASVTVSVNNCSKTFGEADPELSADVYRNSSQSTVSPGGMTAYSYETPQDVVRTFRTYKYN